jgi:hypothetical protein
VVCQILLFVCVFIVRALGLVVSIFRIGKCFFADGLFPKSGISHFGMQDSFILRSRSQSHLLRSVRSTEDRHPSQISKLAVFPSHDHVAFTRIFINKQQNKTHPISSIPIRMIPPPMLKPIIRNKTRKRHRIPANQTLTVVCGIKVRLLIAKLLIPTLPTWRAHEILQMRQRHRLRWSGDGILRNHPTTARAL